MYIDDQPVLIIQAESAGFSAGNKATITINNHAVTMEKNENHHFRGLHIVVIVRPTGDIIYATVFDTYKSSVAFDRLVEEMMVEDG